MKLLTEDALLVCAHELGHVRNQPGQALVTIAGRRVLVEKDPEGRTIVNCPNVGVAMKPCQLTLQVQVGYSDLLHVDGQRVCLENVRGLTDGTPPGTVEYKVRHIGQDFVSEVT